MNKRTPVVNMAGDWEEAIVQHARHLGTEEVRRQVFNVISGRGTKPKSKKQIMESAGIGPEKSQQVTNALAYLSSHHLIQRVDNEGSVADGSRYLYAKEPAVHANRKSIIRRADNKDLADKTQTKRRLPSPKVTVNVNQKAVDLSQCTKLNVLYLTASPLAQESLRVDAEVRLVQQAVRGSVFRDNINIEPRPAADLGTIIGGLNDLRPQIVHFSGHSSSQGIATDNGEVADPDYEDVPYDLLAQALGATDDPPQVVVLNSCESSAARTALLPVVPVIVAMRKEISDIAAAAFAPRFYAAIASGQSVKAAFDQAVLAVTHASISESSTPELIVRSGSNARKIVIT